MGKLFGNLVKDGVLAFARHFVSGIGVWLVGQGYAGHTDEQKWVGAVMTVVALSWSFYDKYAKAQALKDAKALTNQQAIAQ